MLSSVVDSVLRYENQLMMLWEDDRSHLLAEIYRLQALHAKDRKTRRLLQTQYDELSLLVGNIQKSKEVARSVEAQDLLGKGAEEEEEEATQDLNSQDRMIAKETMEASKFQQKPLSVSLKTFNPKRKLTVHSENALNLLMPPSSISKGFSLKKSRDASLPQKKSRDSSVSASKISPSESLPPKVLSGPSRMEVPKVVKSIEVVRKKDQRECLPGFSCSECEKYYLELERQGLLDTIDRAEMLKRCSRHKSAWEPPQTPEGFWELSVHTPANWK